MKNDFRISEAYFRKRIFGSVFSEAYWVPLTVHAIKTWWADNHYDNVSYSTVDVPAVDVVNVMYTKKNPSSLSVHVDAKKTICQSESRADRYVQYPGHA